MADNLVESTKRKYTESLKYFMEIQFEICTQKRSLHIAIRIYQNMVYVPIWFKQKKKGVILANVPKLALKQQKGSLEN